VVLILWHEVVVFTNYSLHLVLVLNTVILYVSVNIFSKVIVEMLGTYSMVQDIL